MSKSTSVNEHYGTSDLTERVADGLKAMGWGTGKIPADALAQLDQFHIRGLEATRELAERLSLKASDEVLDVGCGLGGPSRFLASTYGCTVEGIDLNKPFVDVATMLSQRTGLSEKVKHLHADALHLPFEPSRFDLAITQHVAMNIGDRAGLYAEIRRVLRPLGRLAIYDIVAADGGDLLFPVPWARVAEQSFLVSAGAMRGLLSAAGFVIKEFVDQTEIARSGLAAQLASMAKVDDAPKLGLPMVLGLDMPARVANLMSNLNAGKLGVVQVVAQRSE